MADPTEFQIVHTAWTAAITIGGAIVAFFTKRLVDEVDKKAEQCDIDELKRDIRDFLERQERQHDSNTKRLDTILLELGQRNGRGNR